jgi:hypothetical protein
MLAIPFTFFFPFLMSDAYAPRVRLLRTLSRIENNSEDGSG